MNMIAAILGSNPLFSKMGITQERIKDIQSAVTGKTK